MKKSLLLASMALAAVAPAFAVTDGDTYATTDGMTCNNIWIASLFTNAGGWNVLPFASTPGKARTACLGVYNDKDVVIIGYSETQTEGESSNDYANLVLLDFASGAVIKTVQMTYEGQPIKGLLCANQVGCDQFGNVWFAGYVGNVYNAETGAYGALTVYKVDDMDTGACSVAASLTVVEDEAADAAGGRIDYCAVVGDVTRQEAGCTVMAALSHNNGAYGACGVLGWMAEQGSDDWEPAMDGYNLGIMTDTYPDGQVDWGTAPMVRIILNDEYSNANFYVDGFTTCPTIYNPDGVLVDSFANAVDLAPKTGTNGVGEFTLGGKNFVAYSLDQYEGAGTCQVRVCELGDDFSFEGMKEYWDIPTQGLGQTSDGGTRYHAVETKVFTDENGKEGAYLLTYKCANGIGVYAIAEEGWEDPNQGSVEGIINDNNAPVQYYNLNGVELNGNNLPAGLYITRQGSTTSKIVVK